MAGASSLRLALFPLLRKTPYTNSTFIPRNRNWECFRCCSSSPTPQSYSWQPFRKKKVVMRIAYVGTNYRGHILLTIPILCSFQNTSSYRFIILFFIYFSFRSPNATRWKYTLKYASLTVVFESKMFVKMHYWWIKCENLIGVVHQILNETIIPF